MGQPSFARRAAHLSPTLSAGPPAEAIGFDSGHAFPGLLPDLTEAAHIALTQYRAETLQYAVRPGLPEMRELIAAYMRSDGVVDATADQVLVVNGAKHGLDLLCHLLLDEGDSIVVTAPMYFTAIPIFRGFGVEFVEIGQDDEGLSVDDLEDALRALKQEGKKAPKFIYNVPDYHNPTGITMTRRRREALLAVAVAHGIPVIEDSPYRKVRFDEESEPSLKALDKDHNVFVLGTFSKLVAPGLRVGWVLAPREIIARLVQLKTDGGTCPLTQRIIIEFCKAGRLDSHVENVQRVYRIHRDRMLAAVRRELPGVEFGVPQGGYYVWLKFPPGINTDELSRRAAAAGASIIPGSKFFAGAGPHGRHQPASPTSYIRLAFTHASPEEIDEGVRLIAQVLRTLDQKSAA